MDRRQLLFGMTALGLARGFDLNGLMSPQNIKTAGWQANIGSIRISDRERAGLRGPVKTVVEERSRTEYDLDGNILTWHSTNSDGSEWGNAWAYDGAGRLLKATLGNSNGSITEQVYSYDETGRLLRITDSNGDRTDFHYDEQGRKIEIRSIAPKPDERQGAVAIGIGAVFADIDGSWRFNSYGKASSIKTIYNDRDHPTEMQAYDADGRIITRLVRTYDEKGRISDLKTIIEDPASIFPANERAQMLADSGLPPDEVRAQMKKALSAFIGESGKSYTYDSQGRIKEAVLSEGLLRGKVTRAYTYNDHGDIAEERTTFSKDPSSLPVGVSFHPDENGNLVTDKPRSEWPPQPDLPKPSAVHYAYQYDSYGNWTEKTTTHSEGPSFTTRRELTYY